MERRCQNGPATRGREIKEISVRIRFFGCCRHLVDRTSLVTSFPDDVSLRSLLLKLAERFGGAFRTEILDHTNLKGTLCMAINSEIVSSTDLDSPLKDFSGDKTEVTLVFLAPVSGGSPIGGLRRRPRFRIATSRD